MMREVRERFKVDVERYIRVNFTTFINGIDSVVGIDITLTAAEAAYVNAVTGCKTYVAGDNYLDSDAALAYARCRHIDGDWHRIERVIQEVVAKTKDLSIGGLNKLLNNVLPLVQTNLHSLKLPSCCFPHPSIAGYKLSRLLSR